MVCRIFRSPGPFRGHVVDWIELPHWPVFNLADSAITLAGISIVVLTLLGVPLEGRSGRGHWLSQRSLPVPDGLDGERLDAALARLFGFSRTKAADLDWQAVRCPSTVGRPPSPTACTAARGSR